MYFCKPSKTHAPGLLAWTDTNQSLHRRPRTSPAGLTPSPWQSGRVVGKAWSPREIFFFVLAMALDTHCNDFELARGLINKNIKKMAKHRQSRGKTHNHLVTPHLVIIRPQKLAWADGSPTVRAVEEWMAQEYRP